MPSGAEVLVSIDRTSLTLPALVLSGGFSAASWGITEFTPPGLIMRTTRAPSPFIDGDGPVIAASAQEAMLGISAFPLVSTEADRQAAVLALRDALRRYAYTVTTTEGSAAPQTWKASPGSVVPVGSRTFADLMTSQPVYSITIPVHPIPTI